MISTQPNSLPLPFLFSVISFSAIEHASVGAIAFAILSQWTVSVLLNFQLHRQLRKAGESEFKALTAA
ncbi:MAG: hypothetical protein HC835_17275 [Oscillatoriales cyanobacterium RM2_1_1]|nr:hypothetical protein [Oscillatoriales cyanobacterium RM2_1_1]